MKRRNLSRSQWGGVLVFAPPIVLCVVLLLIGYVNAWSEVLEALHAGAQNAWIGLFLLVMAPFMVVGVVLWVTSDE